MRLLAAGAALRQALGAPAPAAVQLDVERSMAAVRAKLGDTWFATLLAEGRAMSTAQAVACALA